MLTRLVVRNFKRFDEIDVELGNPVVFIGPNNSGKTSALQALALWQVGLSRWMERRKGKGAPEKRSGVTINRRDLLAVPVPNANLLWRNLHVREVQQVDGGQRTRNVRVDVVVEGVTNDHPWRCGLEFDYANDESLYCRLLRVTEADAPQRMPVPPEAERIQVAFLPPMSGLASNETRLDQGAINVRVGEGKTAEVLRNLCYMVASDRSQRWQLVVDRIRALFGAELDTPEYVSERGELEMTYRDRGVRLDLSSSGRGLQQTLLLLTYMYANPGAVLLLDEPDAHLEILRQRQIYQLLTDVAQGNGNQVLAASHSEVLLNEAAGRDVVVAFVGRPHRVDDRGSQVRKALVEIGFESYYQAEQTGWVLYLEGSSDLAILRAFAQVLGHEEAISVLDRPFVHYVGNQPRAAQQHYHGLKEAVPHLKGAAVFDRLELGVPEDFAPVALVWRKREIESYLCYRETLEAYAGAGAEAESAGPLFGDLERARRLDAMRAAIAKVEGALLTIKGLSPWSGEVKASEDFLEPVLKEYFASLALPNVMAKKNLNELAGSVPASVMDDEVREKLDAIVAVAKSATPAPTA